MTIRTSPDWGPYLASFHRRAAGITEDLLGPAVDRDGRSPYEWLLDVRPADGLAIDVGCGSAPTSGHAPWVGVDRSEAELRRAAGRGCTTLALGDAGHLPFVDGAAATVVASMSLMVVADPGAALAEARRVLRPGGSLLVMVPAAAPMTVRDRARMGSVMALVGRAGFPFPHREVLHHTAGQIVDAGFEVRSDECRRFAVPLRSAEDGERFVRSLYLPRISQPRLEASLRLARRWRGSLGIPLRRIVARRRP